MQVTNFLQNALLFGLEYRTWVVKFVPVPVNTSQKKVEGIFKKILRWNGTPPAKYLRIYGKYKYERVEKSWLFPNISLEKGSTLFS